MKPALGYIDYQELLNAFCTRIQDTLDDQLISVVLYGSVARGTAQPDSDVDVLIVLRKTSPVYHERLAPLLDIIRDLRREPVWQQFHIHGIEPYLSVVVLSQVEALENHYLFLDMIDEAIVLFDRNGFFKKRLEAFKERLRALGAKRVQIQDGWYWDLTPDLQPGEAPVL